MLYDEARDQLLDELHAKLGPQKFKALMEENAMHERALAEERAMGMQNEAERERAASEAQTREFESVQKMRLNEAQAQQKMALEQQKQQHELALETARMGLGGPEAANAPGIPSGIPSSGSMPSPAGVVPINQPQPQGSQGLLDRIGGYLNSPEGQKMMLGLAHGLWNTGSAFSRGRIAPNNVYLEQMNMLRQEGQANQMGQVLAPIKKLGDAGDYEGAAKAIEEALKNPRGLNPMLVKGLLEAQTIYGQKGREKSAWQRMAALAGPDDKKKLEMAKAFIDAGGDVKQSMEIVKTFFPDDLYTHVAHEGMLVVYNKKNPKDAMVVPMKTDTPFKGESGVGKIIADMEKLKTLGVAEDDPRMVSLAKKLEVEVTGKPEKLGQMSNLDAAVMAKSQGKYKTAEEARDAGPEGAKILNDALSLIAATGPAKIQISGAIGQNAVDRQLAAELSRGLGFREGFRGKVIIGKDGEENPNLTEPDVAAGKGFILTDDQTKLYRNLDTISTFANIMNMAAEGLTPQPGMNIPQAVEFWMKDQLGVPGTNTLINSLQATKLQFGKIFQGAGAQLSDRDVQSVAKLVISPGDTRQTAQMKALTLNLFVDATKAAFAKNRDKVHEIMKEFRVNAAKLEHVTSGGQRKEDLDLLKGAAPKGKKP